MYRYFDKVFISIHTAGKFKVSIRVDIFCFQTWVFDDSACNLYMIKLINFRNVSRQCDIQNNFQPVSRVEIEFDLKNFFCCC